MYSPALFSAVLLFTASGFSMPADNAASVDGKPQFDPNSKPPCEKTYTPQKGETCLSIAQASKDHGKPFSANDFIRWNPTVGKDCTTMFAGQPYCVTEPDKQASKQGSKHPKDQKRPDTQYDHQSSVTGSPEGCSRWIGANSGDTCWSIASRAAISLEDFFQWNNQVKDCHDVQSGHRYCVAAPTTYRAIGYAGAGCSGAIHNDISVPPGSDIKNGVCINIGCEVGSLKIPNAGDCPSGQVQISYFQFENCDNAGSWYGYGYTSRGQCHPLWKGGKASKSLHLRCASEQDDCATKGRCTVEGAPENLICDRNKITSHSS